MLFRLFNYFVKYTGIVKTTIVTSILGFSFGHYCWMFIMNVFSYFNVNNFIYCNDIYYSFCLNLTQPLLNLNASYVTYYFLMLFTSFYIPLRYILKDDY